MPASCSRARRGRRSRLRSASRARASRCCRTTPCSSARMPRARHRVAPLHAQNRFWHALGVERLPWSARGIATAADLAHAHLDVRARARRARRRCRGCCSRCRRAIRASSSACWSASRTNAASPSRGLVDLGLAACTTVSPAPHMLHLDLQLHQAAATLIEHRRGRGPAAPRALRAAAGHGVLAFQQALVEAIATTFVAGNALRSAARGDDRAAPARSPGATGSLPSATRRNSPVEMDFGGMTHRIALQRAQLVAAVERLSGEVLRLVQGSRPAGTLLHVCVTPRVAAVPGLLERLSSLRDVVVVTLAPGAAALGALAVCATRSCGRPRRSRSCIGCRCRAGRVERRGGRVHCTRCPPRRCRPTCCSAAAPGRSRPCL